MIEFISDDEDENKSQKFVEQDDPNQEHISQIIATTEKEDLENYIFVADSKYETKDQAAIKYVNYIIPEYNGASIDETTNPAK